MAGGLYGTATAKEAYTKSFSTPNVLLSNRLREDYWVVTTPAIVVCAIVDTGRMEPGIKIEVDECDK